MGKRGKMDILLDRKHFELLKRIEAVCVCVWVCVCVCVLCFPKPKNGRKHNNRFGHKEYK